MITVLSSSNYFDLKYDKRDLTSYSKNYLKIDLIWDDRKQTFKLATHQQKLALVWAIKNLNKIKW